MLEFCAGNGKPSTQDTGLVNSPLDEFEKSLDYEDDTAQEMESDIDLLLDGVRDPIDRLYKLSTRIRSPSIRMGSAKAQLHQQIDRESGVDLFGVFGSFDYDYASAVFLEYRKLKSLGESFPAPPSKSNSGEVDDNTEHVWQPIRTVISQRQPDLSNSAESFLLRRIADANVRRRRQFAYWKKHRENLSQHALPFTESIAQIDQQPHKLSSSQILPTSSVTAATLPTPSVTTATRLNIPHAEVRDDRSTLSVSEYAPSAWRLGNEAVNFPEPPMKPEGDKYFECPFCFTICPTSMLAPKAWK